MDEKFLEMASDLEENMRLAAIANVAKDAPETHPDFDGEHCVRCDEPILPGRLAKGKVRCTACQSILERANGKR